MKIIRFSLNFSILEGGAMVISFVAMTRKYTEETLLIMKKWMFH